MYQSCFDPFFPKCGFTGYREFIYHFNEETKSQKQQSPHGELTQDVLRRYQQVLQATETLAKDEQIKEVANLITQADRVTSLEKEAQDWWLLR